PHDIVDTVHSWGGKVFHDVTTLRHARKAVEAGVDGLILVCAGAGGHAGTLNPFPLLAGVRKIVDGPGALSGAVARGRDIWPGRPPGGSRACIGTRRVARSAATGDAASTQMRVTTPANAILCTPYSSGTPGNSREPSLAASGLDPDSIPAPEPGAANFGNTRT